MQTTDKLGQWPLTPSEGFHALTSAGPDGHELADTPRLAPADALPGRQPARLLGRVLRIVDAGPRPFFRAALISLAATSLLAIAVAALTRPPGTFPAAQRHLIAGALLGIALALVALPLAAAPTRVAWLDRFVARQERAVLWLALAAWFPLLLVVVYYRAKATFPPPAHYLYFPYHDKRWETAAYLLGVIVPAIWLVAAARVLAVGRGHPPTWRAWVRGLFHRTAVQAGRPHFTSLVP